MLVTTLVLAAVLAADTPTFRMDFEHLQGGAMPAGWTLDGWGWEEGYRGDVSNEAPFEGRFCLLLTHQGETEPAGRGMVYYRTDAKPWRGKRIAFRAALRVLDPGCSARLFVRGETGSKRSALVAGTTARPVTDPDWRVVEVRGEVGRDLDMLEIAVTHRGRGRVLVDALELEVVGELPEQEVLPPARLDDRAVANHAVLGRLVGYLRYYHPSDQARSADWTALTRSAVLAVEDVEGSIELCEVLQEHFAGVAPTLRMHAVGRLPGKSPDALDEPPEDGEHSVVRLVHRGPSRDGPTGIATELERVDWTGRVPRGWPRPHRPAELDLGAAVVARVPIALFADGQGTLPHAEAAAEDASRDHGPTATPSGNDRATRIASVLLAWSALQHHSPLLEDAESDWDAALERSIREASEAPDEHAFLQTLRRMTAELYDGLASVEHASDWRESNIPVAWTWIDDELVVTAAAQDERGKIGIGPGDVVLRIGSQSAEEAFLALSETFSGSTTQCIASRALESLLRRGRNAPVHLTVLSAQGRRFDVDYKDEFARAPLREPRPAQFSEVAPGVRYVDLSLVRAAHLGELFEALDGAKGAVLDLRDGLDGLRRGDLVPHLVSKSVKDVLERVPISTRPDREKLDWEDVQATLAPAEPRVEAALALLVDGGVVGEAEALALLVREHRLGEVVGEATGGTLGTPAAIVLPGEYRLEWTATDVRSPRKKPIRGIGVEPTVPVRRTAAGIARGEDELLAAAVRALGEGR